MRYDHIDARVSSLKRMSPFYNALMIALGASKREVDSGISEEWYHDDRAQSFFVIDEDASHVPNRSRIAFGVETRAEVDRAAAAVREAGARAVEGPEVCAEYTQPYYAAFFEDPEGNRLEVCCRT